MRMRENKDLRYKLFVLTKHAWNHITVYKLIVLHKNAINHITTNY